MIDSAEILEAMSELMQLVVFRVGARKYALPLGAVERVVQAVEVTPLPKAPALVMGIIDVQGRILPVLNLRRKFGLPEQEVRLEDQFLIARTGQHTVVMVIDEAQGVIEHPSAGMVGPAAIVPGLQQLQGVIQLDDGLALIQDLEKFLSLNESRLLDEAMREEVARAA